jgi:hypothetical protein
LNAAIGKDRLDAREKIRRGNDLWVDARRLDEWALSIPRMIVATARSDATVLVGQHDGLDALAQARV